MKIFTIDSIAVTGSKLVVSLRSHRRHLIRLHRMSPRPTTPDNTDGLDDWQDDGAVGMRGWYY